MKLHGRTLSLNLEGEDIALLQKELRLLGFFIDDQEGVFGKFTLQAVLDFQNKHSLKAIGLVDEVTARQINLEVDALQQPKPDDNKPVDKGWSLIVRGQIQDADGSPLTNSVVRASDKDSPGGELLGEAVTNRDGRYEIKYASEQLHQMGKKAADLIVRVFDAKGALLLTSPTILNAKPVETVDLVIKPQVIEQPKVEPKPDEKQKPDEKPKPEGQSPAFALRGKVSNADGSVLIGFTVRAFDKDLPSLKSEELLGETLTDKDGHYEITYKAEQFRRAEKKSADLIVRVFDDGPTPLASSPVIFNAGPDETVNLVVDGAIPSEFERYVTELAPLLESIRFANLTAEDIEFLTGETGINQQHLVFLVVAFRFSDQTELPAELFYGLFRENLPTDLTALLAQGTDIQRAALKSASEENLVPAKLAGQLEDLLASLKNLGVKFALQSPDSGKKTSLGALLDLSLAPEKQITFLTLYSNHEGPVEEFWLKLREHPQFNQGGQVDKLQFTLQLGALTGNNAELVQAVWQEGSVTSAPDLVNLNLDAWTNLVKTTVGDAAENIPPYIKGASPDERIKHHAHYIVETLKSAFPTKYVQIGINQPAEIDPGLVKQLLNLNPQLDLDQQLPDTINWGGIAPSDRTKANEALTNLRREIKMFPQFDYKAALSSSGGDIKRLHNPIREGVATFLDRVPEFDFGKVHIDSWIDEKGQHAFEGMDGPQKAAVTNQLKALQRVYQVVPRYEAMSSLMSEGLDSALAIASVPEEMFVKQMGQQLGGDFYASVIQESALDLQHQSLIAYGNAADVARDVSPRVIGGPSPSIRSMAAYADLFGRFDLCDCEHCRSVYSPAAYFVDLLEFLNPKAGFWFSGTKPIDILFRRRPDLQHIPLTCENTNTKIPYIDLVNEVLESYVAFHSTLDRSITGDTTPVTSAELMANPQHVNAAAYGALKSAVYPMTLPFNRDLEVVRAYLEHLGSSRYEVMKMFQRDGAIRAAEVARECEYLKISLEERDALTSGAAHRLYGYGDDRLDWKDSLASVQEFQQRTALSYGDLTELLKTRFINPAPGLRAPGAIVIFAPNEKCDPRERRLRHQDGSPVVLLEWDKLQRFIRLWRKLGWTIHDVDRMLTALGMSTAAEVNDDFLIRLGQAVRLQRDLNLPLAETLSFWNKIDTHGDDVETRRENSLYARLFQNRNVRILVAPTADPFELNADGSELNIVGSISSKEPAILAALRISATDLAIIRNATGLEDNPGDPPATPATVAPLNLANLSVLYRYAVLARALRLPIKDLIALRQLTGMDPFSVVVAPDGTRAFRPDLTTQFVEKVKKVRDSEFSVAQLNYLYRHVSDPLAGVGPETAEIASQLTAIRTRLKKIATDAGAPGRAGEILRKELVAVLDIATIDEVMKLLDGTVVYAAPLASLPPGVTFSSTRHPNISYDDRDHQLRHVGPMTTRERDELVALAPTAAAYHSALTELFTQPRNFVSRQMGKFLDQTEAETRLIEDASATSEDRSSYVLANLLTYLSRSLVVQTLGDALALERATAEILLKTILNSRNMTGKPIIDDFLALHDGALAASYFDSTDWTGTPVTRLDSMINFSEVRDWPDAVLVHDPAPLHVKAPFSVRWTGKLLAQANETYTFYLRADGPVRLFLDDVPLDLTTAADAELQGSRPLKAGRLYDIKLEYVHTTGSAVAQLRWESPSTPKAIITQSQLYPPTAFTSYTLLHKVALLINAFKMTTRELAHLSSHGWDFTGVDPILSSIQVPFDLNRTPLEFSDSWGLNGAVFSQWEGLCDLFKLRDALPKGEDSLVDVFSAAEVSAASTRLSQRTFDALEGATGWNTKSLKELTGSVGFNFTEGNLKNGIELRRLEACLQLSKRLGVSVKQLFAWAQDPPDANQAQAVKNAVKAKYEDAQWQTVAKGLNDVLREKQRTALVAHILTLPAILAAGVRDSNQLFEYFLIDVDMSACMATSRIKQAISSVQLFVQRCFMNLERDVTPSSLSAKHWRWMKNYRVWEANRKVFLYPENWIEPELRDDKSPLFNDLENDLLQNEVTQNTAENAFLNYLEKLDEITRLDIRGMYWEYESETATNWDDSEHFPPNSGVEGNDASVAPEERSDILHIFGRTQGVPPIYYYRRFVNHRTWTPWEKVQADVEGDHLIPVVHNRRLCLFWPIFTETTDQNQGAPAPRPDGQPPLPSSPLKEYEIKLAWSENKDNKWSAKKVSRVNIGSFLLPATEKAHFFFKTHVENGDLLITCNRRYVLLDGDHDYLPEGGFRFSGCDGRITTIPRRRRAERPEVPRANHINGEMFEANADAENLTFLSVGEAPLTVLQALPPENSSPNPYSLLYPHQYPQFRLQAPFFYQDKQHTYFVAPEQVADVVIQLVDPNLVRPSSRTRDRQKVTNDGPFTFVAAPAPPIPKPQAVPSLDSGRELKLKQTTGASWNKITVCAGDRSMDDFAPDDSATDSAKSLKLRFHTFYHPHVCAFIRALKRTGIPGLLTLKQQQLSDFTQNGERQPGDNSRTVFKQTYDPGQIIEANYPREDVDFERGAYSLYNWELFFHAPLLIAMRLSKNQRFDEARQWFHYIFDPTDDSGDPVPQRFWKVLPFYQNDHVAQDQIGELLRLLSYRGNDATILEGKRNLEDQLREWQDDPFNPHRIARMRLTAYQKTVVMKYIDNLIAWGDQLFRQDTIESINEATQLYVLAYLMLGPRPEIIPPREKVTPRTYALLRPDLDRFANALVGAENAIGPRRCVPLSPRRNRSAPGGASLGSTFYFCIPPNDKLLGYWDLVADRLFKIRHCMNIEGIVRQQPLFEPPIDPALLVRARAAGIDLSAVLGDINVVLPAYRFNIMVQKASELCAEVKSLGAALLSALEKRDAESLALLRSTHELRLLDVVSDVKRKQTEEAENTLAGLQKSRELTTIRRDHYRDIVQFSPWEIAQLALSSGALVAEGLQLIPLVAGGTAHYVPNFSMGVAGWAGSPLTTVSYGGSNVGSGLETFGKVMGVSASMLGTASGMAGTMGSFDRRWEEWKHQESLANKELEQVAKQIDAATIRRDIAKKELENHELQIENTQAVDEYMRSKFTNRELYDWMTSQISALYFQTYQLAYDIAKRAEKAYQFERGLTSSSFIQFGYWDSLKKGLLAGERLQLDLKRMELAHLEQNRREYEITRHISLAMLDPLALIQLKQNKECFVDLPEAVFDLDYPGHYMRRIKSVGLTIPCVVGPYASVNCTLTLLSNSVRVNPNTSGGYARDPSDDPRFRDNVGAIQSIATSHAQNDSGMFELNFRDERYLAFEGAGAISSWRLQLAKDFPQFDYETISDVVLHVRYTARDGGDELKHQATLELRSAVDQVVLAEGRHGLFRFFSAKREFSAEWHRFLHPATGSGDQTLTLALTKDRFPFLFQNSTITINKIELLMKASITGTLVMRAAVPAAPGVASVPATDLPITTWNGLLRSEHTLAPSFHPGASGPIWTLSASLAAAPGHTRLNPEAIEDLFVVCHYSIA